MINREWQKVKLVCFTSGKNAYGQKRTQGEEYKEIDMVVKIYNQTAIADIRYAEVTNIGLTYFDQITDKNQIIINDDRYNVLYVIPSGRLHQIFLEKV